MIISIVNHTNGLIADEKVLRAIGPSTDKSQWTLSPIGA